MIATLQARSKRRAIWRAMVGGVAVLCTAATISAASPDRPEGLLWNRTGIPATLPLTVETAPGADYYLRLRDSQTGEMALAAYIRGGEAFRVLVPPGRFDVLFDAGQGWQGETALFGAETRRLTLAGPLSFSAGLSRRAGHYVDLTDPAGIESCGMSAFRHRAAGRFGRSPARSAAKPAAGGAPRPPRRHLRDAAARRGARLAAGPVSTSYLASAAQGLLAARGPRASGLAGPRHRPPIDAPRAPLRLNSASVGWLDTENIVPLSPPTFLRMHRKSIDVATASHYMSSVAVIRGGDHAGHRDLGAHV